jgi:hypothetical protein
MVHSELTPWNRVLFEKPTIAPPIKKKNLALDPILSRMTQIHNLPLFLQINFNVIVHLRIGFQSGLFLSGFTTISAKFYDLCE